MIDRPFIIIKHRKHYKSNCPDCGIESYQKPDTLDRRCRSCASKIYAKGTIIKTIICNHCKQEFTTTHLKKKYCSRSCYQYQWLQNNHNKMKEYRYHQYRRLCGTNINFKIANNLRSRLKKAIKSNKEASSAVRDLGCSITEFKTYLESLFQSGMTWDNYGYRGWHIDHIMPISAFDLTNPEEVKRACHYSNLQPMWGIDNIKKGNRYSD